MQEKWNEYWKQLLAVEKELNEFLEDGCLSTIAVGKAKKFLSAWNKQKKLASEMDDYISPVEATQVKIPFKSKAFEEMWTRWKEYLSEQHGQLIRSRSEISALEHLEKISKGNDARAIDFLRYAMANRYRNFFVIDEKDAGLLPRPEVTNKKNDWD